MSAFGGKADITVCGNPLSRSLLGVKRTCPFALHMSAFDPKRTFMSRLCPKGQFLVRTRPTKIQTLDLHIQNGNPCADIRSHECRCLVAPKGHTLAHSIGLTSNGTPLVR